MTIEIGNGKEEEKKKKTSTSRTQERRQHARRIRILQARTEREGGGVAPRPNNRITASATKESREAKRIAKEAIEEANGKR